VFRTSIVAALCTVGMAAAAAPAVAAERGDIRGVCGTSGKGQELLTRSGHGATCAGARTTLRGWRNAGNPRRFRGYRCGEVPTVNVGFARDVRWFATWQCRRGDVTYRVWTRY
jgi:hypothetical protein